MAKRIRQDSISSEPDGDDNEDIRTSRSRSVESQAHTPKYASLDPTEPQTSTMRCLLPGHKPLSFNTYDEYESHYQQAHANCCTDCRKNFPTNHFLDLHIAENHDPIIGTKREADEKTYACFVEGCDKVCRDWKKRRSHLVDKHRYPRNYDFLVVDHGIDGRRSMLRPGIDAQGHRKSSRERERSDSSTTEATETTEATSVNGLNGSPEKAKIEGGTTDAAKIGATEAKKMSGNANVDELTSSMSSLNMVPRSITFGKRKGRSGLAKS